MAQRPFDERGTKALETCAQQNFGGFLHFWRVHPTIGLATKGVEMAFEGSAELNRGYTKPVIFNFSFKFFTAGKSDGFHGLKQGLVLRLGVLRSKVDKTGGARRGFGAEKSAQVIQVDGLGNIKKAQDAEEAASGHTRRGRLS